MCTKTSTACRTIFLFAALLFCGTLIAQAPDQAAMMKAWSEYMTPGEMHSLLAKSDGEWESDVSLWMDPSGQPTKSKGTSSSKMIMGGRYQYSEFKGDFAGQPMEGVSITGYDNAKKVFEVSWIDNLGTGIMRGTGTYDASTKTITYTGTMTDFTSGKDMKYREVYRFVDDNTQMMEMYITPPGFSEFKSMEMKLTRKK